ncbi:hypothetical protein [Emticicia agri]|uniref:Uncharacterized protein n=1 Tax=Emticicia agri TaxID=2492393 RepID=A0A4Q5M2X3_9BACT|nr:hypothetical protein [Emticicia agri]RYU96674.1 hypothetical protein EWM59_05860 [Emticicia agri]
MKKTALLLCLFAYTTISASAQLFAPAFDFPSNVSGKKPAYLTMADGTKIEGTISTVTMKNGLISSINITPKGAGKKILLKADAIANIYVPLSDFAKLDNSINEAFNKHVLNKDVNADIIGEGYLYFEKAQVVKKDKVEELLLQLLNPSFSAKIKVYHFPLSVVTMSTEVKGVTITHDESKSYFIKVGDATAVKLNKRDYNEAYAALYKDCPTMLTKLKDNHRWSKFDEHLWVYHSECN